MFLAEEHDDITKLKLEAAWVIVNGAVQLAGDSNTQH